MLSLLSHLFSALAPLWEMSLTGAYVAVVVLLLRLALRNRAPRQAVCLLWLRRPTGADGRPCLPNDGTG